MKTTVICNTLPIYKETLLSDSLLMRDTDIVLEQLVKSEANQKCLLVDSKNQALKNRLEEKIKEKGLLEIKIIETLGDGGFVYKNKSAVTKVIEGEKPLPSGIDDSLSVYSVEELIGSEKKQIYIDGKSVGKGYYTLPQKITSRKIFEECGMLKSFKGLYFGYPMGMFVSDAKFDEEVELTTDYLCVFDETDCILDQLALIASRFEKESCGQCVFGHEGTTQLKMILTDMTQKKGKPEDMERLLELASEMKSQSLCEVGQCAANSILTAVDQFGEEIEAHLTRKNCKASVCSKFVTYHILPDRCIGCMDCQDVCGDDAILGKKRFVHVIDQDECTQCGACGAVCDEAAIVKAGPVKPRGPKKPIPCKK